MAPLTYSSIPRLGGYKHGRAVALGPGADDTQELLARSDGSIEAD